MSQASAAQDAANRTAAAENERLKQIYAETQRQQDENNRIATEKKSDRIRAANQELGTIRAAAGEMGLASMTPFVVEVGYNEGADLSRIEANRQGQEDSLTAQAKAGQTAAMSNIQNAYGEANAVSTSALFKSIGHGLQLGASAVDVYSDRQKDTV
jgi:hypothetical protein